MQQEMPVPWISSNLAVVVGVLLHEVVHEAVGLLVPRNNARRPIVAGSGATPYAKDTVNDPLHLGEALGAGGLDETVLSRRD